MHRDNWVKVPEFDDYSINPLGQVRKDRPRGRLVCVRVNQYGVPYVGMITNGAQCTRSLPLLVAKMFVPQPSEYFDTPINLDGDRLNCRADNLMWRPRTYAEHYVRQFKEPYSNPINAPIREVETDEEYPNSLAAACSNGLLEREVVLSILNRTVAWPTYQKFVIAD